MANFPGSADVINNPASGTALSDASLGHASQHTLVNDIVELLEAKIGFSESVAQDIPLANTILASLTNGKSKYTQLVNAMISASAAIAYSKLALSNSIVNADINTAAAIAYSKLALSNGIVNADINTAAAIALSKLAAGSAGYLKSNGSTISAGNASAAIVAASAGSIATGGGGGYVNVTGSTITWTAVAGELDLIMTYGYVSHSIAATSINMALGIPSSTQNAVVNITAPGASYSVPFCLPFLYAPGAGSTSFNAQVQCLSATVTVSSAVTLAMRFLP